jgi:hypothetical protein
VGLSPGLHETFQGTQNPSWAVRRLRTRQLWEGRPLEASKVDLSGLILPDPPPDPEPWCLPFYRRRKYKDRVEAMRIVSINGNDLAVWVGPEFESADFKLLVLGESRYHEDFTDRKIIECQIARELPEAAAHLHEFRARCLGARACGSR